MFTTGQFHVEGPRGGGSIASGELAYPVVGLYGASASSLPCMQYLW
jgi:hypothetical protein